ncbi:tetratricopeptide repeat protein [Vibrio salinus]|uniref:tetratricopeptide repeat protein n=1 Tax=Vibrio salinus TaxID=2899784 RepID=UPI001E2DCC4E|nr:tetratricopeptide repeat protein [Vibrio salinus]MCE0494324.1 tetratricopeptide repeat protein [Vibrio salinus]
MNIKIVMVCTAAFLFVGCAGHSKQNTMPFDSELYDGQEVESFNLKDAPKTETEAIKRGDKALGQNNVDLALYEYIRSLKLPKGVHKDKTLYTIGQIHQSRQNIALAEKAYLMALKENPDNVKVLEQLGANFSKQGDVAQGKSYFLRAINADQLRMKAGSQQIKEPLTSTRINGLTVDNQSPIVAYMGLGILYDVDNKHALAQGFYRKALTIDPKSAKGLINMGYSYYMSGDYGEAARTTIAALKLAKNNEKAQNNLALIYLAQNKVQKALGVFMSSMEDYQALNNVGYFLMLQGKPEMAIPYLQQAIDKNPVYYQLANENLKRALAEIRAKDRN